MRGPLTETKFLSAMTAIGIVLLFGFQNCAKVKFGPYSMPIAGGFSSLNVSSESQFKQSAPSTCAQDGSIEFVLSFKEDRIYQCFDVTSQKMNIGPICSEGPRINGFVNDSGPVNCRDLTVCGVKPDITELPSAPGEMKLKYSYRNLPLGCGGTVDVAESLTLASKPHPEFRLTQQFPVEAQGGSCRKCASTGALTCGVCSTSGGGGSTTTNTNPPNTTTTNVPGTSTSTNAPNIITPQAPVTPPSPPPLPPSPPPSLRCGPYVYSAICNRHEYCPDLRLVSATKTVVEPMSMAISGSVGEVVTVIATAVSPVDSAWTIQRWDPLPQKCLDGVHWQDQGYGFCVLKRVLPSSDPRCLSLE